LICLFLLLVCTSSAARSNAPSDVSLAVSNPACTQPSPTTSACLINVRSIIASSSDPTFLGVQIRINGKTRAFFTSFFENSVYINNNMLGKGLEVTCGRPNASGLSGYGLTYNVGISAVFSGSSSTTDTAVVNCPAFESRVYFPTVKK
jgi:hypothetical protein